MTPPTPAELGARLKAERERLGLTRPQAAERIGFDVSVVRDWEVKTCNPTYQTVLAILRAGYDPRRVFCEMYSAKKPTA